MAKRPLGMACCRNQQPLAQHSCSQQPNTVAAAHEAVDVAMLGAVVRALRCAQRSFISRWSEQDARELPACLANVRCAGASLASDGRRLQAQNEKRRAAENPDSLATQSICDEGSPASRRAHGCAIVPSMSPRLASYRQGPRVLPPDGTTQDARKLLAGLA